MRRTKWENALKLIRREMPYSLVVLSYYFRLMKYPRRAPEFMIRSKI